MFIHFVVVIVCYWEDYLYTYIVFYKGLAGGEYVGFNNAVFLSEREAADRNYALGFYMREHKCFPEKDNMKESMDFYFQVWFHY